MHYPAPDDCLVIPEEHQRRTIPNHNEAKLHARYRAMMAASAQRRPSSAASELTSRGSSYPRQMATSHSGNTMARRCDSVLLHPTPAQIVSSLAPTPSQKLMDGTAPRRRVYTSETIAAHVRRNQAVQQRQQYSPHDRHPVTSLHRHRVRSFDEDQLQQYLHHETGGGGGAGGAALPGLSSLLYPSNNSAMSDVASMRVNTSLANRHRTTPSTAPTGHSPMYDGVAYHRRSPTWSSPATSSAHGSPPSAVSPMLSTYKKELQWPREDLEFRELERLRLSGSSPLAISYDRVYNAQDSTHNGAFVDGVVRRAHKRKSSNGSAYSDHGSARSPSSSNASTIGEDDNTRPLHTRNDTTSEPPVQGKNSRYLREMDRRAILSRLAKGEKQATLAKEYQVSRAAICNLNKHRDEVMSRVNENPHAKHPKKRKTANGAIASKPKTTTKKMVSSPTNESVTSSTTTTTTSSNTTNASNGSTAPSTNSATVHEVASRAVRLLLTSLRDRSTPLCDFRRVSERIMRLVLEEALAVVSTKAVQVSLNDHMTIDGIGMAHPPCAISMEQSMCPMMDAFHLIEPDQPTGYVRIDCERHHLQHRDPADCNTPVKQTASVSLLDAHLPSPLSSHNVFLVDVVASSGEVVCATIELLKSRGANESMIFVVALIVSSDVVAMVQGRYPGARIVTAMIDSTLSRVKAHTRGSPVDAMLARFDQVYMAQTLEV